jgi:cell division protein FtsB
VGNKRVKIPTREEKIKKRKRRRILAVLFSIFFTYFVVTVFSQQATMYDQEKQKEDIQQQIAEVENEQSLIRSNMSFSTSDGFTERQAREKLGWVKEGELKFVPAN